MLVESKDGQADATYLLKLLQSIGKSSITIALFWQGFMHSKVSIQHFKLLALSWMQLLSLFVLFLAYLWGTALGGSDISIIASTATSNHKLRHIMKNKAGACWNQMDLRDWDNKTSKREHETNYRKPFFQGPDFSSHPIHGRFDQCPRTCNHTLRKALKMEK